MTGGSETLNKITLRVPMDGFITGPDAAPTKSAARSLAVEVDVVHLGDGHVVDDDVGEPLADAAQPRAGYRDDRLPVWERGRLYLWREPLR